MIRVVVDDVGKRYRRYDANRVWTLQQTLLGGFRRRIPARYFWSLRHLSFTVQSGTALGVVGRNGAGKSTLLRLLGGIGRPDEGRLQLHGTMTGLLELTAGFHSDFTGRENVVAGGILRGLRRMEVLRRLDDIVDFAELAHCIDQPLRTYSSGMQMRLAFAVAVHAQPDILLVDEVLAVGDMAFQNKCLDRIRQLKEGGCAIVLVSHDPDLVGRMCEEALWLHEGSARAMGTAATVSTQYAQSQEHETIVRTREGPDMVTSQGAVLRLRHNRYGAQEIAIEDVRIVTASDSSGLSFVPGDLLTVEMSYRLHQDVDAPVFNVTLIHDDGRVLFGASTNDAGVSMSVPTPTGQITLRWHHLQLDAGMYFLEVGVYERHWKYAYDYHSRAYPLTVRQPGRSIREPAPTETRTEWVANETADS